MHCGSVLATKARAVARPKAAVSAAEKSFSLISRTSMSAVAASPSTVSLRLATFSPYSPATRAMAAARSTLPPASTCSRIGRSKRRMPFGRAPMRRSEPKASAMNPRCSSLAEKRVYCCGAPVNEPGGAGCLPEAASAAGDSAKRIKHAASERFICRHGLRRSRTRPSCATEATSVPSRVKIKPREKPREPCRLGESCA